MTLHIFVSVFVKIKYKRTQKFLVSSARVTGTPRKFSSTIILYGCTVGCTGNRNFCDQFLRGLMRPKKKILFAISFLAVSNFHFCDTLTVRNNIEQCLEPAVQPVRLPVFHRDGGAADRNLGRLPQRVGGKTCTFIESGDLYSNGSGTECLFFNESIQNES